MCSRDDSVLFVQWTSVCHHSMLWFTASYADDTQLYIAIEKKDYVFNKESYMERCIAELMHVDTTTNTCFHYLRNIIIICRRPSDKDCKIMIHTKRVPGWNTVMFFCIACLTKLCNEFKTTENPQNKYLTLTNIGK